MSKFIIISFPHFTHHTIRVTECALGLPDVKVGLVTHDPIEGLREDLREKVAGHWRTGLWELLEPPTMAWAVSELSKRHGPVHRLISPQEHVQGVCAAVREEMGIPGPSVEVTSNFRDKARMKDMLRAAGVPCAKSRRVCSEGDAWTSSRRTACPWCSSPSRAPRRR